MLLIETGTDDVSISADITGLSVNTTYHYRVVAVNGIDTTNGDDMSFTTPPITLNITAPSNGDTINRPDVIVKGTITNATANETGVTVNGMVATIYGNQFIANHVPLTEGQNTITVTATDTAGYTASTSIIINAITTGNYIKLTANIESGTFPLETTLSIDGSFSTTNSNISVSGPGSVEWLSTGTDEYRVRMTTEGIYYFTASVTGPSSIVYQDSVAIVVLNAAQLDALLRAKWEAMKTALANQDVEGATNYFPDETKQSYIDLFNAIGSQLPQVVQDMQDIELIYAKNNTVKYRIRRNDLYNGQVITITYYIYFVLDKDGLWKIYQY